MQEFNKQGFIKYMYEQFPTVFENSFTREFLDNLVDMYKDSSSTLIKHIENRLSIYKQLGQIEQVEN